MILVVLIILLHSAFLPAQLGGKGRTFKKMGENSNDVQKWEGKKNVLIAEVGVASCFLSSGKANCRLFPPFKIAMLVSFCRKRKIKKKIFKDH